MSGASVTYGGNRVIHVPDNRRSVTFADDAYRYSYIPLAAGAKHRIPAAGTWTVYVLGQDREASVTCSAGALHTGDTLQVDAMEAELAGQGGTSVLLVAGLPDGTVTSPRLRRSAAAAHYRVAKPWGHELWLNGDRAGYVLKEVFIRAGNRTSLQYHRLKRETNVLAAGRARLIYRAAGDEAPSTVVPGELQGVDLEPISTVDVWPGTLHRLEALTDVFLYEASTPHLDDVVRVQDDTGRGDGRIATEHQR